VFLSRQTGRQAAAKLKLQCAWRELATTRADLMLGVIDPFRPTGDRPGRRDSRHNT